MVISLANAEMELGFGSLIKTPGGRNSLYITS